MKTTITILIILSISIAFIACKCTDIKKQPKEPEQIRYHAERMKRYVPVEINCPVEIAWKIRNRKLIKKYWRQQP